jgi:hypothetical protein
MFAFERRIYMLFGLGFGAVFWCILAPGFFLVFSLVVGLRGRYEGESVEEKYGERGWYYTF